MLLLIRTCTPFNLQSIFLSNSHGSVGCVQPHFTNEQWRLSELPKVTFKRSPSQESGFLIPTVLFPPRQAASGSGIFVKHLKLFSEGLGHDPGPLPFHSHLHCSRSVSFLTESLSWNSGHFEMWGWEGDGQGYPHSPARPSPGPTPQKAGVPGTSLGETGRKEEQT